MTAAPYLYGHPLEDEGGIAPTSMALNLLWLVFGGAAAAMAWFIAALVMTVTVVGLPWARAAFENGLYTLWPFGVRAVGRTYYDGPRAAGGPFRFLGNLIWFLLAGWWLAMAHVVAALILGCTIIGAPFAWAHLKLAGFALWPLGRRLAAA